MKVQYHFPFHITQNLERDGGPPKGSVSKIILFFSPPPSNNCSKKFLPMKYKICKIIVIFKILQFLFICRYN